MKIRNLVLVTMAAVGLVLASATTALAGPGSSPSFGVVDPLDSNPNTVAGPFSGSCPWPNAVDAFLPEVEKCLPKSVGWAENGVRIVSDPLVGTGGAWGAFTFWCQSKTGLHYLVTVHGLQPNSTYMIHSPQGGHIGTLRTDPKGDGVAGGVMSLPPGDYEWDVHVGSALSTLANDAIGFEVF